MHQYFVDYAKHFKLESHIRLGIHVTKVIRDEGARKWIATLKTRDQEETTQEFDRIVVANGTHNKANVPNLDGQGLLNGKILHSRDFKK